MYGVNFYGQNLFGRNLAELNLALPYLSTKLPQSALSTEKSDVWSNNYEGSSFERLLIKELGRIDEKERMLKNQLQALNTKDSVQQNHIKQQFMALEKAKKLAALFVEQMYKSLQTIAANFR